MNFRKFGEGWIVETNQIKDSRGYLVPTYEENEFSALGLNTRWPLQLQSLTNACGIVRGMHWQDGQIKLVRCILGLVTDVIVDVRYGSPSFGVAHQVELSADDMRALYIPVGFAHGYQCISEYCIMQYSLSSPYDPKAARRFNCQDPEVNIPWPLPVMKLSEQDAAAPMLSNVVYPDL